MKIILASQSPRRRDLLQLMGLPFTVQVSGEEEHPPKNATPDKVVECLSAQKAGHVFKEHSDCCVIGADTIVELDGEILGKPKSTEQAKDYLSRLQGRAHHVYTGITVMTPNGNLSRSECVTVHFRPMNRKEIDWYVSTGDPMDKAGGYGLQGGACCFISHIEGNFFNAVGISLPLLYDMLLELKVLNERRDLL